MVWFRKKKKPEEAKNTMAEKISAEENDFRPVNNENFRSSYWQPVGKDKPYKSVYKHALYMYRNEYWVTEVTVERNGNEVSSRAIECGFWEALKLISSYENQKKSENESGALYEKMPEDEILHGKHYAETGHENLLFFDEDNGLPHLNKGGVPLTTEVISFSESELALVRSLELVEAKIPPPGQTALALPNDVAGNLGTGALAVSFSHAAQGFDVKASLDKPYDVNEHKNLLALEQKLGVIKSSLASVGFRYYSSYKGEFEEDKWGQRSQCYSPNVDNYNIVLKNLKSLQSLVPKDLAPLIDQIALEAQTVFTTWITQTAKHETTAKGDQAVGKEWYPEGGVATRGKDSSEWAQIELEKLQDKVQDYREKYNDDGAVHSLEAIMPIVMADYSVEEFKEIHNKFLERISDFVEDFTKYRELKAATYNRDVLKVARLAEADLKASTHRSGNPVSAVSHGGGSMVDGPGGM